jgi:hypothetical protein
LTKKPECLEFFPAPRQARRRKQKKRVGQEGMRDAQNISMITV